MSTDPTDRPTDGPDRRRVQRRHVVRLTGRGRRALDEFLVEVGKFFTLPPKDPSFGLSSVDPPLMTPLGFGGMRDGAQPPAPPKRLQPRTWLPALAVLVLACWGLSIFGWTAGHATVPVAFRGTWASAHYGYEGRRLVITESTVHVIVSEDTSSRPAVVRSAIVRSTPRGQQVELVCATENGADTIDVTLLTPDKLVLRRPDDVVWERLVDRHTSAPDSTGVPDAQPLPSRGAARDSALRRVRN
ncbi:MAG TPA: hypothetical protein VIK25_07780 [Gemmatimonadaceae bacterium]